MQIISLTPFRHDGLKKTELELELEDFLVKNSSQYSGESRFANFYNNKRRSESSPVKKEAPSSFLDDVETKTKAVRRRVTKAADEILASKYVHFAHNALNFART